MTDPSAPAAAAPPSRAPLATPLFRALWIATVVSNIGTWMNDVGSAWLMTSLSSNPLMVALVQAATTLPIFLFALPGGALADVVDRRRLLIGAQMLSVSAAATLAILTQGGMTTAPILLGLTFVLGLASALSAPAFQAIVPELVDRPALADAVAVNSLGVNIARSVGPALGGLIVALSGPAAVYALNAVSVLGVIAVLVRWRREPIASPLPPEHFWGALRAGVRYARGAPALQLVLIRAIGFFAFASALWALLPVVGRHRLGLDAAGYGLLLACVGAGAVLGAVALTRLRRRVSPNRLSIGATGLLAGAIVALAGARQPVVAYGVMLVVGGAWIAMLSSLNVAAQQAAPSWVRARTLAVYLVAFQGAMTLGSLVWGSVASRSDVGMALTCAGLGLLVSLGLAQKYPLPGGSAPDLTPSGHWAAPEIDLPVSGDRGPVMVMIDYRIAPEQLEDFLRALIRFRTVRERDGAVRWNAWEDAADSGRVVETFVVESWMEHLRQHERTTGDDRISQEILTQYHLGPGAPRVRHLIAPPRR